MRRDSDNANSLAAKLKGRPSQPQIHKFLTGTAKEPRRPTLEPLAAHFGVPVEAFYDPAAAARAAAALGLPEAGDFQPSSTFGDGELTADEARLLADFRDLVDDDEKQQFLEQVATRADKARALREKVQDELLAALSDEDRELLERVRKANAYRTPGSLRKRGT